MNETKKVESARKDPEIKNVENEVVSKVCCRRSHGAEGQDLTQEVTGDERAALGKWEQRPHTLRNRPHRGQSGDAVSENTRRRLMAPELMGLK